MAPDRLSTIAQWLQQQDDELLYRPDVGAPEPAIVLPPHYELHDEVSYRGEAWTVVQWTYVPQQHGSMTYTLRRLARSGNGHHSLAVTDAAGLQPLER